jgi:hypothetical protein
MTPAFSSQPKAAYKISRKRVPRIIAGILVARI